MHFRVHLGIAAGGFVAYFTNSALALVALLGDVVVTRRVSDALEMSATLNSTPTFRLIGYFCVGVSCLYGGFCAARIARQSPFIVGALSAWLFSGLALYGFVSGRSESSLTVLGGNLASFVALGALGGALTRLKLLRAVVPREM